ncbi:MAG: flagellin [Phycisphaeraceae bacterium]|nr:flagellin [Phycisphaeraceae bacterium]
MSRINTNPNSLIAQRNLGINNNQLSTTLERLSTGLRINRGKDDPAGLIASENLRSEKTALSAAISNAERADQIVNIAEGGLQELSGLLTDLRSLVTTTANAAGLSKEEKSANQLQIDSILQTIDRLADATNFQGVKLLNGNFDFTTNSISAGVTDFRVNAAKLGRTSSGGVQPLAVQALITTSAQQAGLFLSTGGNINLGGGGSGLFTIEVAGNLGSRELSFASGTTVAQIVAAVNTYSDVTGVSATAYTSGGTTDGLRLRSTDFGSDAFVSVKVVNAANIQGTQVGIYNLLATDANSPSTSSPTLFTATAAANGVRDAGQDLVATINGIAATAKGKTARINSDFLDVEVTFNTATAQAVGAVNAFTITGGGAEFQLASKVDIGGKVAVGIQNVAARKLGNSTLGFLASLGSGKTNNLVDGNVTQAGKVVEEAIRQVSALRGRLGAFQKNTVGATIRSLGVTLENNTAAESVIRDADFASETASLTRSQILSSAAANSLSLANSQPQAALQLLR